MVAQPVELIKSQDGERKWGKICNQKSPQDVNRAKSLGEGCVKISLNFGAIRNGNELS